MPDRRGPILMNLIPRKIAPKTRIITDMWRGYNAIPRLLRGKPLYKHATVNHSKNFFNPADPNIHTQNIVSLEIGKEKEQDPKRHSSASSSWVHR